MVKDILLQELGKIREPETGETLLNLGLIDGIDLRDGTVYVYVNFDYMNPSCKACSLIHLLVVRSIVRKMERVLRKSGYSYQIIEAGKKVVYAQG